MTGRDFNPNSKVWIVCQAIIHQIIPSNTSFESKKEFSREVLSVLSRFGYCFDTKTISSYLTRVEAPTPPGPIMFKNKLSDLLIRNSDNKLVWNIETINELKAANPADYLPRALTGSESSITSIKRDSPLKAAAVTAQPPPVHHHDSTNSTQIEPHVIRDPDASFVGQILWQRVVKEQYVTQLEYDAIINLILSRIHPERANYDRLTVQHILIEAMQGIGPLAGAFEMVTKSIVRVRVEWLNRVAELSGWSHSRISSSSQAGLSSGNSEDKVSTSYMEKYG